MWSTDHTELMSTTPYHAFTSILSSACLFRVTMWSYSSRVDHRSQRRLKTKSILTIEGVIFMKPDKYKILGHLVIRPSVEIKWRLHLGKPELCFFSVRQCYSKTKCVWGADGVFRVFHRRIFETESFNFITLSSSTKFSREFTSPPWMNPDLTILF